MLKRLFAHKVWAILLAFLTMLALLLLAMSLRNLRFQPGRILQQEETHTFQVSVEGIILQVASIPLWKYILFGAALVFVVVVIALFLPPELRKRLFRLFLRLTLFVVLLYFILKNYRKLFPGFNLNFDSSPGTGNPASPQVAPPVFTPPQVSPTQLYLISLAVILALSALAIFIGLRWLRKFRAQTAPPPLQDLAEVARLSLADISAGRAWEDVIIQCYAQMSEVVAKTRGLHRRQDLTPREFAGRLESAGLPGQAVGRLTRLFESVRYGSRQPAPEEANEAVACLTDILHECEGQA